MYWQSHHTLDLVSDPIFRAAMRGYDQVSFVFGLEVTWSLIQQRQQEEEERQAMLELEKMDEIEAAFNDDTEEANQQDESDGGIEKENEDTEKDGDDEQPAAADKTSDLVDGELFDSDSDEQFNQENSSETDKEEVTEIEAITEMEVEADEVDNTKNTESEAVALEASESNAPIVEESAPIDPLKVDRVSEDTWECLQCTYANKMSRKTCEMCKFKGNPKRRKK